MKAPPTLVSYISMYMNEPNPLVAVGKSGNLRERRRRHEKRALCYEYKLATY